jgi:hypothetical protein
MQNASWLFKAVISIRQTSEIRSRLIIRCAMAIPPTDIRILFTNYDIIAYFLDLASCSEHFISIKHRILAPFNINKKIQF